MPRSTTTLRSSLLPLALLSLLPATACDAPEDPMALDDADFDDADFDDVEALAALDDADDPVDEPADTEFDAPVDDLDDPAHVDLGRTLVEGPDGLVIVTYEDIDGLAFVDGDIVLGPVEELIDTDALGLDQEQLDAGLRPRGVTPAPLWGTPWPNGRVYYVLPQLTPAVNDAIADAIAELEAETDFDFFAIPGAFAGLWEHHIEFSFSGSVAKGAGASSSIGARSGGQDIYFSTAHIFDASAPSPAVVIHELGHAVGLYHEHQRHDRDDYVTIVDFCIQNGKSHNFGKRLGLVLGPYDVDSIMHYPSDAFSIGCPTLWKNDGTLIGYNSALTTNDVFALDWLASF